MTNVFAVVGELRDDPDHLLVLGDDGAYYDYVVATGQTAPVQPDHAWTKDTAEADFEIMLTA